MPEYSVVGQRLPWVDSVAKATGQARFTFLDYKLPTALEMPDVDTILVEPIEPVGPFGAKGMGEGTAVPTSPAIANAVQDAMGIRLKSLTMTPQRILKALEDQAVRSSPIVS